MANAQNANMNAWSGAQGQVLDQFGRNRNAALQMDQLRNQRDLAQYGEEQQALADSNAMWGGMLGGGLQGIAYQNITGQGPLLDLGGAAAGAYQYGRDLFSGSPKAPYAGSMAPVSGMRTSPTPPRSYGRVGSIYGENTLTPGGF
jgi:hypothetical protein